MNNVALRIDWDRFGIVDPEALLTEIHRQPDIRSVPRDVAEEYIAAATRFMDLFKQVEACPQYRAIPAVKLVLDEAVDASAGR